MENVLILLNHNGILLILCGLPSSGKSIFAISLKQYLHDEIPSINIEIIDIDQIRHQIDGNIFIPENEAKVRQIAYKRARELLNANYIVFIDDVNYYNSMRQQFRQIAMELDKPYLIVFISTPIEICLQWNANRAHALNEEILTKIASNFDVPGQKYAWDAPYETIDLSKSDIPKTISQLGQHIMRLIYQYPDVLDLTKQNVHIPRISPKTELDQLTRLFIHLYALKNHSSEKMNIKTGIFSWKGRDLTEFFNTIAKSSLFYQIQQKFHSNIESLNTVRKIFLETQNDTNIPQFNSKNLQDRKKIKELFADFMAFLLIFQNQP